jgi:hypothetical protein
MRTTRDITEKESRETDGEEREEMKEERKVKMIAKKITWGLQQENLDQRSR